MVLGVPRTLLNNICFFIYVLTDFLELPIRYLTLNFGTPIRYRYEVSLFVRAGTVYISGCLFHHFLLPFGSLLAPFGRLWRPFLDPGTTPGPFRAQDANSCEKITIWSQFGCPRGPQFETFFGNFGDFLAIYFSLYFVVPIFLTNCSSRVHLGFTLRCFLGYLGPLEIGLKR